MDGASKFVSGNVKVEHLDYSYKHRRGHNCRNRHSWRDISLALTNYISLAIGDGTGDPISCTSRFYSTGLIVTRSVSDGTFGSDVTSSSLSSLDLLDCCAFSLFLLSFRLPWYVLIPMAGLCGYVGYGLTKKEIPLLRVRNSRLRGKRKRQPCEMAPVVPLDPLSLELGYGLIPLVDKDQGAEPSRQNHTDQKRVCPRAWARCPEDSDHRQYAARAI